MKKWLRGLFLNHWEQSLYSTFIYFLMTSKHEFILINCGVFLLCQWTEAMMKCVFPSQSPHQYCLLWFLRGKWALCCSGYLLRTCRSPSFPSAPRCSRLQRSIIENMRAFLHRTRKQIGILQQLLLSATTSLIDTITLKSFSLYSASQRFIRICETSPPRGQRYRKRVFLPNVKMQERVRQWGLIDSSCAPQT